MICIATENPDSITKTLSDVVVTGKKNNHLRNTDIGRITIMGAEISKMPMLLGEPDIIRSLQMQPGISQGIEGFSGLYVHGGEDDQNLMIYDGMPLYQVSHLGGLFSSFNVDAVRDVDFYKTSFPAQYGGRISSITDINMREPNKQKFTGSLSLGLISGKAYLTGPIKTNQTAFSLALRRTWIDAISAPTLATMNAIDKKNGKKTIAGYAFTDVNFKLSHIFNARLNASLMAYYSKDKLKFGEKLFGKSNDQEDYDSGYSDDKHNIFNWGNQGLCATLKFRQNNFSTKATAFLTEYSSYNIQKRVYSGGNNDSTTLDSKSDRTDNSITDIGVQIDNTLHIGALCAISFGMNYTHHSYLPERIKSYYVTKGVLTDYNNDSGYLSGNQMDAWTSTELSIKNLIHANLGVRYVNYWSGTNHHQELEPRASLRLGINDYYCLKLGYARMSQFAQQISNNHISLPTDLWQPTPTHIRPLYCHHFSSGLYGQIHKDYSIATELWYKRFFNLLEYREGISALNPNMSWQEKITSGKGWAYGLDFNISKTKGKLTGSISYALMWNWRKFPLLNEGIKFPAKFDNRHKINVFANFNFNKQWSAICSWTYTTGNRFTLSLYNYDTSSGLFPDAPSCGFGDVSGDVITGVGYVSSRNNTRLPAYHRMDIGVTYTKKYKNGKSGVWNFGIYNAYCHMNAISIQKDEYNNKRIDNGNWHRVFKTYSLIPAIPSVSYTYNF